MLSPLPLPCLPNDEVVFTTMSSASVLPIYIQRNFFSINFDPNPTATKITLVKAELSRSVNDHHHHHHGRHHRGHHHCLAWSSKGSYFRYLIN